MPTDWPEVRETKDGADAQDSGAGLSSEGIRAVQGIGSTTSPNDNRVAGDGTSSAALNPNQSNHGTLEEPEKPYDESQLEYRLGSPHADYEMYKDTQAAERRHELGQQATTGDSLADAINTTLAAHKEAHGSDETPLDQYVREKHGPEPYTAPAYEDEDE